MMINRRIVIMGPPGSGKSTQAERLADQLHLPYLSTGELLRSIVKANTPLGQQIAGYLDQGTIVPDDLTIQLVLSIVSQAEYANGYVGEGFPRTLVQAEAMDSLIDQVLYIQIPDAAVIARLLSRQVCSKCGESYNLVTKPPKVAGHCDLCQSPLTNRSDDNQEVITTRLAVYHHTTEPVIAYFQSKNKLIVVDGKPAIEAVSKDIVKVITQ